MCVCVCVCVCTRGVSLRSCVGSCARLCLRIKGKLTERVWVDVHCGAKSVHKAAFSHTRSLSFFFFSLSLSLSD